MDSNKLATAVSVVMSLFASLPNLIKAIEQPGNGVAKAATITTAVAGTLDSLPADIKNLIHADAVIGTAQAVTSSVVAINNAVGAFKTNSPQSQLQTAPASSGGPRVGIEVKEGEIGKLDTGPLPDIDALKKHIANMERRLAEFQAGSAPDKQQRIEKLTKNIAEARAELASLE